MQIVLNIAAIFAAVCLLILYAAPPAKPIFTVKKRLPTKTVLYGIRLLAERCAEVEYGFGIKYSSIKIKKLISDLTRNRNIGTVWRDELLNYKQTILSAYEESRKSICLSSALGHVGKYPRLFLFCNYLAENTCGNVSEELLIGSLGYFTAITQSERKCLPDYIRYCLVGLLYTAALAADKRDEVYAKGKRDGALGRVDLDLLESDDYISGIDDAVCDKDRNAVRILLENNGVDIAESIRRRRESCAETYAVLRSVLRSLDAIHDYEYKFAIENKKPAPSKRYIVFCNIVLPSLLFLYAIVTCIFAPVEYVALYCVISVITYGALRLPVLIGSPSQAFDIFDIYGRMKFAVNRSKKKKENIGSARSLLSENAFWGDIGYDERELCGGKLCVYAGQNHLTVKDGGGRVYGKIDILFDTNDAVFDLSAFGGICEPHRAVYRTVGETEVTIDVIPSPDSAACVCRLTVVNGRPESENICIKGLFASMFYIGKYTSLALECGEKLVGENETFSISLFGADKDIGSFARNDHEIKNNVLCASGAITVPPFGKRTVLLVFAVAATEREAVLISECAAEENTEYILDYLKATTQSNEREFVTAQNSCDVFGRIECSDKCTRHGSAPENSAVMLDDDSGFTAIGEMYFANVLDDKNYVQTVTDGTVSFNADARGILGAVFPRAEIFSESDFFKYRSGFYAIIEESGVLWSPTAMPLGKGRLSAVLCPWKCEYRCDYNGIFCTQKSYLDRGNRAVIIDMDIFNSYDSARKLNVMLSAVSDMAGNLKVLSSDEITERALFIESYTEYGKIVRTDNFNPEGDTSVCAATIKIELDPMQSRRVLFYISDESVSEMPSADYIDKVADGAEKLFGRLGRIVLHTGDELFDLAFRKSIFDVYTYFLDSYDDLKYKEKYYLLGAAKYADCAKVREKLIRDLPTAVESNDGIYIVFAVMEYVKFSGNRDFLNYLIDKISVTEYCMRSIEKNLEIKPSSGLPGELALAKILSENLSFFADRRANDRVLGMAYTKAIVRCSEHCAKGAEIAKNTDDGCYFGTDALLHANDLYECDEYERAYGILRENVPIKYLTSNKKDYITACAVFYKAVTEKLLGIKINGKHARINPCVAGGLSDIEFDLLGSRDVRICIDRTCETGNWRMKVDRISYAADSIDLSDNKCDKIIFYRDGLTAI